MEKTRWRYLALGTVAMLFMGVIYAWSIMKVPLAETFGWDPSQLALNYSLIFCFFCLGSMGGSYLSAKRNANVTILLGGIFIFIGYVLSSRLTTSNVTMLYLSFGLPIGAGTGMAYNTILSWIGVWFPDKRGTCSGVLMMGFGFSALILGKVIAALFALPALGWRRTYVLLGCATMGILLLCALMFRHTPPVSPRAETDAEEESQKGAGKNYTPAEMLRRPSFWNFYLYGIIIGLASGAVFAFAYDLCLSLGAGMAAATTLVGVLSACNGMSRIFTGMLYDRIGRRRTMFLGSAFIVAGAGLLLCAVVTGSLVLGAVGLCVTGLAYGYGPVIGATVVSAFYGAKHFSANYSLNNSKTLISSFSSLLATTLLSVTGSYAIPFAAILSLALLAFFLHFHIQYA